MLKVILKTFLGLALLAIGVYMFFVFLEGITDGGNYLLFTVSVAIVAFAMLILSRAGKSNATVTKKNLYADGILSGKVQDDKKGLKNTLEKNNALTSTWEKTSEARTRLKILGAAADAQK